MTKEIFIQKAKEVHGDKYNYNLVNLFERKIRIVCPIHGEFLQTYNNHLNGHGCPKCGKYIGSPRLSNDDFIKKVKTIHGLKYDYSKTNYTGCKNKVIVTCPEHGDFEIFPYKLQIGRGCPKCKNVKNTRNKVLGKNCTTEHFIELASQVHSNYYNYSNSNYINSKTPIIITCPEHGNFTQLPLSHINGGICPKCRKIQRNYSDSTVWDTLSFIENAKIIHGNKYDYKQVEYINCTKPVKIICKKHGTFEMNSINHISKRMICPQCSLEQRSINNSKVVDNFVVVAEKLHPSLDFTESNYIANSKDIKVICPEHGEFITKGVRILNGCGCPRCSGTNGEKCISEWLTFNKINFVREYKIFCDNKNRYVDFYVEFNNNKFIIEYNGLQHYVWVKYFHRDYKDFENQIIRDASVKEYCQSNNINLIEIPYNFSITEIHKILSQNFKINNEC